jgi:uracil-DNA glycosylase family 4
VRTRREVAEALGLGPLWVARSSPSAAVESAAADVTRGATQPGATSDPLSPAARVQSDAPPAGDDRPARILRLDWGALETAVAGCTACALAPTRTRTVFGVGDKVADWLFVGEGPGAEEDQRGEPFVGQAGRLLDNMLGSLGLARGRGVYIANIVKCRPPGNRNPDSGEALACRPFLERQVDLIRPKLIVALGKVAATNLLGRDVPVGSLRGHVHAYRGVPMIVTYHPAYLLRNLPDKAKAWEDLCFARDTMAALVGAAADEAAAAPS